MPKMDSPRRRLTDLEDAPVRMAALEITVKHAKEAIDDLSKDLKEHVAEEHQNLKAITSSIQRLAFTSESHQTTLTSIAGTLQDLAAQGARITSLEEYRVRTEKLDEKQDKLLTELAVQQEQTSESVGRLYWVAGLVATAVSGLWAVATRFKLF